MQASVIETQMRLRKNKKSKAINCSDYCIASVVCSLYGAGRVVEQSCYAVAPSVEPKSPREHLSG